MIGLIGAMDEEIKEYLGALENKKEHNWNGYTFYEGTIYRQSVVILRTGVGKVLSAMVTQKVIDTFPISHILFSGIAGSINNGYDIGDIVIGLDTAQHDMDATSLGFSRAEIPYTNIRFVPCDKNGIKYLEKACSELSGVHTGRILTGDLFLDKKHGQEYVHLIDELDGDAVEMEGASVGTVAMINNIPFNLVRIISDKADGNAPHNFKMFLHNASVVNFEIIKGFIKEYGGNKR